MNWLQNLGRAAVWVAALAVVWLMFWFLAGVIYLAIVAWNLVFLALGGFE